MSRHKSGVRVTTGARSEALAWKHARNAERRHRLAMPAEALGDPALRQFVGVVRVRRTLKMMPYNVEEIEANAENNSNARREKGAGRMRWRELKAGLGMHRTSSQRTNRKPSRPSPFSSVSVSVSVSVLLPHATSTCSRPPLPPIVTYPVHPGLDVPYLKFSFLFIWL